jgi:hypothetical protein
MNLIHLFKFYREGLNLINQERKHNYYLTIKSIPSISFNYTIRVYNLQVNV